MHFAVSRLVVLVDDHHEALVLVRANRSFINQYGRMRCSAAQPDTRIQARHQSAVDVIEHRSEEHTSELQSLMRISYAVFCLNKKHIKYHHNSLTYTMKT